MTTFQNDFQKFCLGLGLSGKITEITQNHTIAWLAAIFCSPSDVPGPWVCVYGFGPGSGYADAGLGLCIWVCAYGTRSVDARGFGSGSDTDGSVYACSPTCTFIVSLVCPCRAALLYPVHQEQLTKLKKTQNQLQNHKSCKIIIIFLYVSIFTRLQKHASEKTHWFYLNHSTFEINAERTLIDSVRRCGLLSHTQRRPSINVILPRCPILKMSLSACNDYAPSKWGSLTSVRSTTLWMADDSLKLLWSETTARHWSLRHSLEIELELGLPRKNCSN